jgi:hypothetical protein
VVGRKETKFLLILDVLVQLRNKAGTTIVESKEVAAEKRDRECTTQVGTKVSCPTTERRFCFDGKPDGDYQLAVIVFLNRERQQT